MFTSDFEEEGLDNYVIKNSKFLDVFINKFSSFSHDPYMGIVGN